MQVEMSVICGMSSSRFMGSGEKEYHNFSTLNKGPLRMQYIFTCSLMSYNPRSGDLPLADCPQLYGFPHVVWSNCWPNSGSVLFLLLSHHGSSSSTKWPSCA